MQSPQTAQPESYCRCRHEGNVFYGRVEDGKIFILSGPPWDGGSETEEWISLPDVTLLHPSEPRVILGLGGAIKENWIDKPAPKTVRWFSKPPGAAASPGDDIILPAALDEIKVEVELVIVIGKSVKDAAEDKARDAIFGYTVGNDIVGTVDSYYRLREENIEREEPLLAPGLKICDRFAPFGPFIVRKIDWRNRTRTLRIIGKDGSERIRYEHSTSELLYPPEKIVSDLSQVLLLSPGDIILTGTTKSFPVHAGEVVEVSIEGLGTFRNRVCARSWNTPFVPSLQELRE
jgi:2-keto-4-pentenoate hydratase/2-oxohepta-3-ene-1,7-dioic acid hydratase in catechol pathway